MDELAREAGLRLAGAYRGRRIYASGAEAARSMVRNLHTTLLRVLEQRSTFTVGVIANQLAVAGSPYTGAPASTSRLAERMIDLGIEVIMFYDGLVASELEILLNLLTASKSELAGESLENWLIQRGVEHIQLRHLRLDEKASTGDLRSSYRRASRELTGLFSATGKGHSPRPGAFHSLAKTLLDNVLQSSTPLTSLIALKDRDDRQVVHSVNVACIVGIQARSLGLDEPEVQQLVAAALTHDIGKTRVPEGIIQKAAQLTNHEREWLDKHTAEGGKILLENGDILGAVVAAQHHTPLKEGETGHLAVELTKIADIFDGLRTLVPYTQPVGRRAAIAWMRMHPLGMNNYLFERFARLLDAVPVDSHCMLDTGELVRIVEVHPELAFHPVVEVCETRGGTLPVGTYIDLTETDLLLQRVRSSPEEGSVDSHYARQDGLLKPESTPKQRGSQPEGSQPEIFPAHEQTIPQGVLGFSYPPQRSSKWSEARTIPDQDVHVTEEEQAEYMEARRRVNDLIAQRRGGSFKVRGRTKELTARGRADELTARGRAEEPTARGRADELTARGRADELTARGRAEEPTARGRADELTARGRAEEPTARGRAEELTARGRANEPAPEEYSDDLTPFTTITESPLAPVATTGYAEGLIMNEEPQAPEAPHLQNDTEPFIHQHHIASSEYPLEISSVDRRLSLGIPRAFEAITLENLSDLG